MIHPMLLKGVNSADLGPMMISISLSMAHDYIRISPLIKPRINNPNPITKNFNKSTNHLIS